MFDSLSLTVPVPCTLGHFGDKLVTFQTQVKASEITNLLGHDPRSKYWSRLPEELQEMYSTLQRKTSKGRREGTKRYIEERFASGTFTLGAFPAIAIGTVSPMKFTHYADKYQGIQRGVGELAFNLANSSVRVLLDGMARVAGALELLDDNKADLANSFAFPVTIFTPSEKMGKVSIDELGQLFHDFNFLSETITTAHAIDLDQSSIYIQMVNALSRSPVIRNNGGIEPRAASLGAKSTALVAKQVLLRFVRGAVDGPEAMERLRDRVAETELNNLNLDLKRVEIENFLSIIAETMGPDFKNHELLHLAAPGWNALGVVFYDLHFVLRGKLDPTELDNTVAKIGRIDWSRWNQDFIKYLGDVAMEVEGGQEVKRGRGRAKPVNPETLREVVDTQGRRKLGTLYGGRLGVTRLVQYIRKEIGLMPLLYENAPSLLAEAELTSAISQDTAREAV